MGNAVNDAKTTATQAPSVVGTLSLPFPFFAIQLTLFRYSFSLFLSFLHLTKARIEFNKKVLEISLMCLIELQAIYPHNAADVIRVLMVQLMLIAGKENVNCDRSKLEYSKRRENWGL